MAAYNTPPSTLSRGVQILSLYSALFRDVGRDSLLYDPRRLGRAAMPPQTAEASSRMISITVLSYIRIPHAVQ